MSLPGTQSHFLAPERPFSSPPCAQDELPSPTHTKLPQPLGTTSRGQRPARTRGGPNPVPQRCPRAPAKVGFQQPPPASPGGGWWQQGLVGDGAEPHTTPAPHSPSGRRAGGSGGAQRREELGLFIYRCVYLWKAFRRSHRRGGPGGSAAFRVSQPAKLSFPAGWEAQGCAPQPGPPCGPAAGNAAPSPAAWPGFKRLPASHLGEKVVFG